MLTDLTLVESPQGYPWIPGARRRLAEWEGVNSAANNRAANVINLRTHFYLTYYLFIIKYHQKYCRTTVRDYLNQKLLNTAVSSAYVMLAFMCGIYTCATKGISGEFSGS